jgi:hypothetical protein
MARSFPLGEGGSATGVLITDRCQGPGCDDGGVHLFSYEEQSTSEQMDQKKGNNEPSLRSCCAVTLNFKLVFTFGPSAASAIP